MDGNREAWCQSFSVQGSFDWLPVSSWIKSIEYFNFLFDTTLILIFFEFLRAILFCTISPKSMLRFSLDRTTQLAWHYKIYTTSKTHYCAVVPELADFFLFFFIFFGWKLWVTVSEASGRSSVLRSIHELALEFGCAWIYFEVVALWHHEHCKDS